MSGRVSAIASWRLRKPPTDLLFHFVIAVLGAPAESTRIAVAMTETRG